MIADTQATIDKLNSLYENDLKVLDCEILQKKQKKRIVMAESIRNYYGKINSVNIQLKPM